MLITDFGCAGRFGSVVTDAEISFTTPPAKERCLYFHDGSCWECITRCPVKALSMDGAIDKQRGYIVGEKARGRGVASVMCDHSQREAAVRGFRAMQFNFVVATNETAIRLWRRHGFEVVGTLPGAFFHPDQGYVDAFVMYKRLDLPG